MLKLLDILDRLILIFVKWSIQREQLKAQRQRDELLKNPADWFAGHFNSVPNDTADKTSDKTDADNTKSN